MRLFFPRIGSFVISASGGGGSKRVSLSAVVLPAAVCLLFGIPVAAEDRPTPFPTAIVQEEPERVTCELILSRKTETAAEANLDDAVRQEAVQNYDAALAALETESQSAARLSELQTLLDGAPDRLREIAEQLRQLQEAAPAAPPAGADLESLKNRRIELENELDQAKKQLAGLEAEAARRKEIPRLLATAREELAKLNQDLLPPPTADVSGELALSQRTLLLAQRQMQKQTIAVYEKELSAYDTVTDLLSLQQREEAARVAMLQRQVTEFRIAENRAAEREARQLSGTARQALDRADPLLRPLLEENVALAESAEKVAQKTRLLSLAREKVDAELDAVRKQFQRTRRRVDTVGLTNAIGLFMRTQRASLPSESSYLRNVRNRQKTIREIQTQLFEWEDEASEIARLDPKVNQVVAELAVPPDVIPPERLEARVREFLIEKSRFLDVAIRNYNEYLRVLFDMDDAESQIIHEIGAYRAYIDERVLWIRSAEPIGWTDLTTSGELLRQGLNLYGWAAWSEVADALRLGVLGSPWLMVLALSVFLLWFGLQRRLRNANRLAGQAAAQSTQSRILPTLESLVLTLLIASLWPALLGYLGWRIEAPLEATDLAKAVAAALARAAEWLLPLEILRQVCRPGGLGESHFGWPAGGMRILRGNIRWLIAVGLPCVFVLALMQNQAIERGENSLGRIAFLILTLGYLLFFANIFHPNKGVFRFLLGSGRDGWFYRSRYILFWAGILIFSGSLIAASVGYFYTVHQLFGLLRETIFLILGMVILGAVLARWILVIRRRLAIERARQRRAAMLAAATDQPDASTTIADIPTETMDKESDLTTVSRQTRRLIHSFLWLAVLLGAWSIWSEMLPALTVLDRIPLWPTTVRVTESITMIDGSVAVRTTEQPGVISLGDLALALVVLLMTVIAARNVAGLLEISIPQRVPLDAGVRYAITTLTRYVVTIVGLVLAFGVLGLGWTKVQWLIAALGVGLGFGLQEIFANFISGLIILFERPIRVGDVVTVRDVTGVVTRIQTRATTVTNWDRKEFIVPNKEFITGQILNWTHGDQINRIVINVGVAYGADVERARSVLLRLVAAHPEVMQDPAPSVTLEGFGDNSLLFVIRCFLPRLNNRLATTNDLHTAIEREFRTAGIEIAFPQRDLHIRSWPSPPPPAPNDSEKPA